MYTIRIYSKTGCLVEVLELAYRSEAEDVANAFEELTTYNVERDYDD